MINQNELKKLIQDVLEQYPSATIRDHSDIAAIIAHVIHEAGYTKLEEGMILIPETTWKLIKDNSISIDSFIKKYLRKKLNCESVSTGINKKIKGIKWEKYEDYYYDHRWITGYAWYHPLYVPYNLWFKIKNKSIEISRVVAKEITERDIV